jgi:hypothetical protein
MNGRARVVRARLGASPQMRGLRDRGLLYWSGLRDLRQYAAHSGLARGRGPSVETLEARITMEYHRIEKGLSLRSPRPWFGQATVQTLLDLVVARLALPGADSSAEVAGAFGALEHYKQAFKETPAPLWWPTAAERLAAARAQASSALVPTGGIEQPTHHTEVSAEAFARFARARHSIRDFDDAYTPDDVIARAVALAATSPSVCNRQATRVRKFRRGPDADRLLRLQNGNRGFGDSASHVLLVTTDVASFVSPGERNQGLIDGGLFCMTLIYALHSEGVASCCLNWSVTYQVDDRLRRSLSLPPSERVVMMIAIGYARHGLSVAISPARGADRVLVDP